MSFEYHHRNVNFGARQPQMSVTVLDQNSQQ